MVRNGTQTEMVHLFARLDHITLSPLSWRLATGTAEGGIYLIESKERKMNKNGHAIGPSVKITGGCVYVKGR